MGGLGSGRRVTKELDRRRAIIDKAWNRVEEILNDKTHCLRDKSALEIALKDVVQHIKGEGFDTKVFVNNIKAVLNKAHTERTLLADTSGNGNKP